MRWDMDRSSLPCTLLPVSQPQEAKASLGALGSGPARAVDSLFKSLVGLFVQGCTILALPGPFPSSSPSLPVERGRKMLNLAMRLA